MLLFAAEARVADLIRSPLHDEHLALGGRMVDFAGFELPVRYDTLANEHNAVRSTAGLFDVSHMGEIDIVGPQALELVQHVSCNDHRKMRIGRAQYTGLMTDSGTFVDDMLVHRIGKSEYLLVVNASNHAKDLAHLQLAAKGFDAEVVDRAADYSQIALQGPAAAAILQPATDLDLAKIRYYRFKKTSIDGIELLLARTGYTGEDGFEIYVAPDSAPAIWRRMLELGRSHELRPCGLGARDTLRMEAGMPLYGHEIDDQTTPLDVGLSWIVKLEKGDFLGRDRLAAQAENGCETQLIGIELIDRGIARQGYPVLGADGTEIGSITSGTMSPSSGRSIAMAKVGAGELPPGSEIVVQVRSRQLAAKVVEMPFYSRKK